ncbi:hypothetical protein E2986_12210 [Frieseomelitta varia]|uniref:Uncharacterized protein n=1 Tax=Frieseomelitta varia TaxID=561572 RepID=A0A833RXC6_9HYME|nr:hypothetical protein E2986_12210 [Frieseomelitta varia]
MFRIQNIQVFGTLITTSLSFSFHFEILILNDLWVCLYTAVRSALWDSNGGRVILNKFEILEEYPAVGMLNV